MIIIGLDGKNYKLKASSRKKGKKSKLHIKARKLIAQICLETFYEEVTLVGSKTKMNTTLYADFLSIKSRIIIEVHGAQHYEHITHFHKTKKEFVKAKLRDETKKEWAELNSFILIELPHDKEDEWEALIRKSLST
jgi:very-short-patch-repair endonuclease